MKPLTRPMAVLFDMDGLMLDTEPLYQRAWEMAGAELGVHISDELYLSCIGQRPSDNMRCLRQAFGKAFNAEDFWQRRSDYWRQIVAAEGIPHKEGLSALLDTLAQAAIPIAIATSNDRATALFSLQHAQLEHCYQALITGDQVKHGKPAPDIFLAAAAALQAVPEQCWVLEDAYHGIRAGYQAGAQTIWIPDLLPPNAQVLAESWQQHADLYAVQQQLLTLLPLS